MRVLLLPVVLLGLAACGSGSSDSATPATSSTQSTAAPTPTTPVTSPTSTDQPMPPSSVPASTAASTTEPTLTSPPWDFTFGDVDGLVAVDAPHASDYPLDDEVTAVWATSKGITDGYMTLRDVKGGPATSPEGDVTATRIEAPTGEAWLVIDNVPVEWTGQPAVDRRRRSETSPQSPIALEVCLEARAWTIGQTLGEASRSFSMSASGAFSGVDESGRSLALTGAVGAHPLGVGRPLPRPARSPL
jgi:hypothetical protein